MTKPFKPDYLKSLVKSQLANAAILRKNLGKTMFVDAESAKMIGSKDKEFMDSLYAIMEEELSNPELNMEDLAARLLLSRTALYNKLKQLTGEAPANLFKRYKLNRAAQMLRKGQLKVSAVAEAVGFSQSYFSKVFQEEFGLSPSQYMKK